MAYPAPPPNNAPNPSPVVVVVSSEAPIVDDPNKFSNNAMPVQFHCPVI